MHRIRLAIFLAVMLLALISAAQAPDAKQEQQQVLALVKEVQAQQTQIVANQNQIDEKLAALAETMRVARIFSSRTH
jgi:outer membrane lipoprotein-sorting protein